MAAPKNAWADAVEDEEAANGGKLPEVRQEEFPTLHQAAKAPAKAKKAKAVKLSLHEFAAMTAGGNKVVRVGPPKTEADLRALLPTASTGRVDGEAPAAIGGGFGAYGGAAREGGYRRRDDIGENERPSREEMMGPSRAEEVDDWGSVRKFVPSDGPSGGGSRGGFSSSREGGGGFSDRPPREVGAADLANDWGSERKFEPSSSRPGGGGGGSFSGDSARRGFEPRPVSKADEEDQWARGRAAPVSDEPPRRGFGGFSDAPGRPGSGSEDRWARRGPSDDPAGAGGTASTSGDGSSATAGGRPRLALAPRTKPVEAIVVVPQPGDGTSGSGSANGTAGAENGSSAATAPLPPRPQEPPKPRSNPFGAARPREEVLKEKGVDVSAADAAAGVPSPTSAAGTTAVKGTSPSKSPEPPVRKESPEETAQKLLIEDLAKHLAALSAEPVDEEDDPNEEEAVAQVRKDLAEEKQARLRFAAEEKLALAQAKLQAIQAEAAEEARLRAEEAAKSAPPPEPEVASRPRW